MLKLPLELTFNEFVQSIGGELIEKLVPNNNNRKRADYLFRSPLIIAELKCLEQEINIREIARKLTLRMNDWTRKGLMPKVYGRAQIDLQKLPKPCQDEWLELYEAPIQKHVLSDANKQIREAKESLGFPEAKGVVLIANERQTLLSPADLLTFTARILKKKKPDGTALYSSIHRIVLFSANVLVVGPEFPRGMVAWFPAYREGEDDPIVSKFLSDLGFSWMKLCASKRDDSHGQVLVGKPQIEAMRFVLPNLE